jgi:hypothetical protein
MRPGELGRQREGRGWGISVRSLSRGLNRELLAGVRPFAGGGGAPSKIGCSGRLPGTAHTRGPPAGPAVAGGSRQGRGATAAGGFRARSRPGARACDRSPSRPCPSRHLRAHDRTRNGAPQRWPGGRGCPPAGATQVKGMALRCAPACRPASRKRAPGPGFSAGSHIAALMSRRPRNRALQRRKPVSLPTR